MASWTQTVLHYCLLLSAMTTTQPAGPTTRADDSRDQILPTTLAVMQEFRAVLDGVDLSDTQRKQIDAIIEARRRHLESLVDSLRSGRVTPHEVLDDLQSRDYIIQINATLTRAQINQWEQRWNPAPTPFEEGLRRIIVVQTKAKLEPLHLSKEQNDKVDQFLSKLTYDILRYRAELLLANGGRDDEHDTQAKIKAFIAERLGPGLVEILTPEQAEALAHAPNRTRQRRLPRWREAILFSGNDRESCSACCRRGGRAGAMNEQ